MAINYAKLFNRRSTPQSQSIPGSTHVPNLHGQRNVGGQHSCGAGSAICTWNLDG